MSKGANTLKEGAGTLKDGASKLTDASGDLKDGSKQLSDGTDKIVDAVNDAEMIWILCQRSVIRSSRPVKLTSPSVESQMI